MPKKSKKSLTLTPTKNTYKNLLKEINITVSAGLMAAQKAIEIHRMKTYWTVGRKITDYAESSREKITLGKKFYEKISVDINKEFKLDLSAETIQRSVQFSNTYPKLPEKTPLSLAHYRVLMRVGDEKERLKLEKMAMKNHMGSKKA